MDNGSSREVRKKIREWRKTKARQRRESMATAEPDPNAPF